MRLFLGLFMASLAAAIAISHFNPAVTPQRVMSQPPYQVLESNITALHGGKVAQGGRVFRIDRETGRLDTLGLPPAVGIDLASLSPWEEEGRRQIVGIGWDRSGSERSIRRGSFGVVRMQLPEGEVLDRVSIGDRPLPRAAPCWIRRVAAGVLYVASDFRLYRIDFENFRHDGVVSVANPHPVPLAWRSKGLGAVDVQVMDLSLPDEPMLGGRALASLRYKDRDAGRWSGLQVWWLQLDPSGTTIVADGPVLQPDPADAADLRCPDLVKVRGEPTLFYLKQPLGESDCELRVAPIHFDPDTGAPHAHEGDSYSLAERCPPTSPVASADGRWLTVVRNRDWGLRSERVAVPAGERVNSTKAGGLPRCCDPGTVDLGRAPSRPGDVRGD